VLRDRPRPVLIRHCWVTGLSECPGRWAGLLAEWRQDRQAGGWQGRVVYAVDDGAATVNRPPWGVPTRSGSDSSRLGWQGRGQERPDAQGGRLQGRGARQQGRGVGEG